MNDGSHIRPYTYAEPGLYALLESNACSLASANTCRNGSFQHTASHSNTRAGVGVPRCGC